MKTGKSTNVQVNAIHSDCSVAHVIIIRKKTPDTILNAYRMSFTDSIGFRKSCQDCTANPNYKGPTAAKDPGKYFFKQVSAYDMPGLSNPKRLLSSRNTFQFPSTLGSRQLKRPMASVMTILDNIIATVLANWLVFNTIPTRRRTSFNPVINSLISHFILSHDCLW
jgi:hypothetical protein